MYKINELSKLSGLSKRALRYYDEIDLLKPMKDEINGYRYYNHKDLLKLQKIMVYKELDFTLEEIKGMVENNDINMLLKQKKNIEHKIKRYEKIGVLIQEMIEEERGGKIMSDDKRFETLKDNLIQENEDKYGEEIRRVYKEKVDEANKRIKNMSKEQFHNQEVLADEIIKKLLEAFATGNPGSPEAREACRLHAMWIENFWGYYSESAHFNLVNMYLMDERFTHYYDQHQSGLTEFFVEAMAIYLNMDNS